ncbi:DUF2239 family protein [Blastopirellula retiformator]|uniref:DUF2239 domain-containing protein n=1 Tax=Blastopirellula retiformator TaxID=2527970 RepID=A0A5C5USS4_9BACT|nr:DUF2239 family protein [Blastopirellula retiformator]TWT29434.1 hypothetical protein Enr8_49500 [Blastopirellula retiformator]
MATTAPTQCTAFAGTRQIGSGELATVAPAVWQAMQADNDLEVLVYEDATGTLVDFDFYGSLEEILDRLDSADRWAQDDAIHAAKRPQRKAVVREVKLLPRHWQWLDTQPGGASAALRRLVEEAKRVSGPADRVRRSQEAAYHFMADMAGDLVGFEEANRALFAGDLARFEEMSATWPVDVTNYIKRLGAAAFAK